MKIHFIGIGGIGMSALAKYFIEKEYKITGSDLDPSEITESLKKLGVEISIGHNAKNLKEDTDLVIYSNAILPKNPELKRAKKLKIKIQSYPEALGTLTKKYFTIAIAGAHGKGTTTAVISLILIEAGFDPTVIIGTKLKEFSRSNFRIGKSKYLIIEADEYRNAFLNYWPKIIVLTNIDKEHLDYFENLNNIIETFKEFIKHLPKNGFLILNKDDDNIKRLKISPLFKRLKYYSLKQKEAKKIKNILKIPGEHNVANALAALIVARSLKISDKISFKAISKYKGAWRRFEIKKVSLKNKTYTLISDYAHHPTEIKATLQGVKEKFKNRKIFAVFQPHQSQRLYYLFDEFKKAFDLADEIVLTNIYKVIGREKKEILKKTNAKNLERAIKRQGKLVHFIKDFQKIPEFLKSKIKKGDVILIMGAGNIYKIFDNW